MAVDQLKRWHWALIGIVVGLMIAYVHTGMEPDVPYSIPVPTFLNEVGDSLPHNPNRLYIEDIVLHPPTDPAQSANHRAVQVVTFRRAVYDEKQKGFLYKAAAMNVELPFKLHRNSEDDYGGSFENYMKALAADNDHVKYRVAWWEVPKMQYLIWTTGCLVIIGGVWPTIINVLVGAGFGPQKREEDYDLGRFGKGKKTEAPAPSGRRAMTAEEQSQLQKLTAKFEGDLAPSGAAHSGAENTGVAGEQAVRKLEGKPLEIAQIEREKEDKEYKGEFYPVAKQGGKKEEKS